MMATWDDVGSSSSKKDKEHAANLCLMVAQKKMRYLILKVIWIFSNWKALEQAFDNLMILIF